MPRLRDLSRSTSEPLVVPRAKQKPRANLLQIVKQRVAPPAGQQLDLKPRQNAESGFFVTEKSARRETVARLKIAAGALVLVLFFNLLGTFGTAKQTASRVAETAGSSLQNLLAAGQALAAGDFVASGNNFATALAALAAAQKDVQILTGAGAVLATQPAAVQSGAHLLAAGKSVAAAGVALSTAADRVTASVRSWSARQALVSAGQTLQTSFADEIAAVIPNLQTGMADLETAAAELKKVDAAVLPPELAAKLPEATAQLNLLLQIARPYLAALPQLPVLLGARVPQRYLVLLQNTAEIRPTGGFIGNYALITFNDGFITEFKIKDVYELDGQLVGRFPPPEGYEQFTNFWGLRDSNISPNFAQSAQNAAWLLEQGGGGSVDGVVAVTADVLPALVAKLGGTLALPRWQQPVAAADLLPLLSLIIESKQDGVAAPKQILPEIWGALAARLPELAMTDWLTLAHTFTAQKDVQVWLKVSTSEDAITKLGLAGQLPAAVPSEDLLAVIHTSFSGNKSDAYMQTHIAHATQLAADGMVTDTVTLTRTHGYNSAVRTQLERLAATVGVPLSQELLQLLGAGPNRDFVKIFVPAGAVLQTVAGIEPAAVAVRQAEGRTYFQFLLTTLPGSIATVALTYQLPTQLSLQPKLHTFRQAGINQTLTKTVTDAAGEEIFRKTFEMADGEIVQ